MSDKSDQYYEFVNTYRNFDIFRHREDGEFVGIYHPDLNYSADDELELRNQIDSFWSLVEFARKFADVEIPTK